MKALVVDENAIGILDAALIDDTWFKQFALPRDLIGLRRVVVGITVYILSDQADLDSGYLVVNVGDRGVFSGKSKPRPLFERIMRVALRHFNRNITMPVQWQPFHVNSLMSIYAEPFSRQSARRIYFDQAPRDSGNIYAYTVTEGPEILDAVRIDWSRYDAASATLLDALTKEPSVQEPVGNFGILLSAPLGLQLAGEGTLQEWYDRKLSEEQIRFVDKPLDQPIRLRGAAGTGKTQAMAVKCLRDLYADNDSGGDRTFAFLTHSSALAHEVIRGMFFGLDPTDRWLVLRNAAGRSKIWVGTLYELAQKQLGYEKKGLKPLSLDGREGRELQRILIDDAITSTLKQPKVALSLLGKAQELCARLSDEASRPIIVEELMNEFACVLDAENVRKGTPEAARYVAGAREAWQMFLPNAPDRELVLEIHDAYRNALRKEGFLSMDQMIADFGRYLSTHEWNQLRERDGFDLIFVDEYHYFTRSEAMTLHNLFVPRAQHQGRWPLIMAYDLKQSTNDAALGGGLERFRNPGVGESVPVDLNQVFRSTPQIAAFLSDLDASFPAMDLEGEFSTYSGRSQREGGEMPELQVYDTDTKLIDGILAQSSAIARQLAAGGSQVAVLCLNEQLFDAYRGAGRTQGKIVSITAREDLKELRYARSRCVFSMPEYVAGLQFDTVFVINADKVDLEDEHISQGARRRYVSRAYLGASRAARRLVFACSRERGGPSSILETPLRAGSLIQAH